MEDRTCSRCDRPAQARGWCRKHYMAWYRSESGSAIPKKMGRPPVPKAACLAPGCEAIAVARGLCNKHYRRLRKSGSLSRPDVEARFFANVTENHVGCWVFASLDVQGYGQLQIDGAAVRAHRWCYEFLVGPVPEGLVLDHLCRNPACVNPDHLDPVTQQVNTLRGVGPAALNAAKKECLRGHAFSPENTYITPDGRRMCRSCQRIRARKS